MLGTTGAGYAVAEALGHSLQQPYPALTPLLGRHPGGQQLAGVSLYSVQLTCKPAEAAASGAKKRRRAAAVTAQRSAMLFTHRGFSGPAVLDLSHHVVRALERGEPLPGGCRRLCCGVLHWHVGWLCTGSSLQLQVRPDL